MRVAVVGAGALGRVYGVRLAAAGHDVTFVVRAARAATPRPFVLERANADGRRDRLDAPRLATEVPDDAEAAIVAVRVDHLDGDLSAVLRRAEGVALVVVTPLLPRAKADLDGALGRPVVAAQPGVVAYENDAGVVRYWLPRVAPTRIEASGAPEAVVHLAQALDRAGLPTRLEPGVTQSNPATTATFFPIVLALDAAGGTVDDVLARGDVLDAMFAALRETRALAGRLGTSAPWAGTLARFASPLTLRVGVRLARSMSPEGVAFAERHFGQKTHAQNLAVARALVALLDDARLPRLALARLIALAESR